MRRKLLTALAGIGAALLPAIAPLAPARSQVPDCAGTQIAMNQCAGATLRAADRDLNRRYQAAMQSAPDEEARAKLLERFRFIPAHSRRL